MTTTTRSTVVEFGDPDAGEVALTGGKAAALAQAASAVLSTPGNRDLGMEATLTIESS